MIIRLLNLRVSGVISMNLWDLKVLGRTLHIRIHTATCMASHMCIEHLYNFCLYGKLLSPSLSSSPSILPFSPPSLNTLYIRLRLNLINKYLGYYHFVKNTQISYRFLCTRLICAYLFVCGSSSIDNMHQSGEVQVYILIVLIFHTVLPGGLSKKKKN